MIRNFYLNVISLQSFHIHQSPYLAMHRMNFCCCPNPLRSTLSGENGSDTSQIVLNPLPNSYFSPNTNSNTNIGWIAKFKITP